MADKDYYARLVIYDFDTMPGPEVKRLAAWLRAKADEIASATQSDYSSRYTSRLMKRGK